MTAPLPPPGPGRRLDASRDVALLNAALQLVAEEGYDRVSMDAIAARARASKATIYRRWPSKAALVTEAVRCRQHLTLDLPITGSLRGDLLAALRHLVEHVRGEELALMTGVMAAMRSDPELAAALHAQLAQGKAAAVAKLLAPSRARGEIPPGVPDEMFSEVAPAMILTRLVVTGEPVDEAFLVHVVDDVLLPLLTRPVPAPSGPDVPAPPSPAEGTQ